MKRWLSLGVLGLSLSSVPAWAGPIDDARCRLEQSDVELRAASARLADAAARLDQARVQRGAAACRSVEARRELAGLDERAASARERIGQLRLDADAADRDARSAADREQSIAAALPGLRDAYAAARDERARQAVGYFQLLDERDAERRQAAVIDARREAVSRDLLRWDRFAELTDQLRDLERQLANEQRAIRLDQRRIDELRSTIERTARRRDEMVESALTRDAEANDARREAVQIAARIARLETAIDAELSRDPQLSRLGEQLRQAESDLAATRRQRDEIAAARARIDAALVDEQSTIDRCADRDALLATIRDADAATVCLDAEIARWSGAVACYENELRQAQWQRDQLAAYYDQTCRDQGNVVVVIGGGHDSHGGWPGRGDRDRYDGHGRYDRDRRDDGRRDEPRREEASRRDRPEERRDADPRDRDQQRSRGRDDGESRQREQQAQREKQAERERVEQRQREAAEKAARESKQQEAREREQRESRKREARDARERSERQQQKQREEEQRERQQREQQRREQAERESREQAKAREREQSRRTQEESERRKQSESRRDNDDGRERKRK